MAIPTRGEALATLRDGKARIDELLDGLSEEELTRPATIGGGEWSAKDLMGHIATWEEMALEAFSAWRNGTTPWFDQEPYVGSGSTDGINAVTIKHKAGQSIHEIRARAEETHHRLVSSIQSLTDDEWGSKIVWRKEEIDLAGRLGGLTSATDGAFRHAFDHIPDLEAYAASLRAGRTS
jgi:hypothetical protein